MLRLRKRHRLFVVSVLVGEDDYEVLAVEVFCQFLRQSFHSRLVRYGAFTGRHDDKEMVVGNGRCYAWQLVPMSHLHASEAQIRVAVRDKLVDHLQRVHAPVELYLAVEVPRDPCQTFYPPAEAWLVLGTGRYDDNDPSQRRQGMIETCHDDLPVETVEQALMELSPEFWRHVLVHVHADEDLRSLKLLKGMLDAIGDICCHAHLSIHFHVRARCVGLHLL